MSVSTLLMPNEIVDRPAIRPRLRIGVMLDAWTGPAWIARVLADIAASSHSQNCLVILNRETHATLERS